jgi:hypothetical protein
MTKPTPAGIDPRGPRFGASITSVLLLITVFLGLDAATVDAAFYLLIAITALFAVGAIFGLSKHPYGFIFKKLVRPRLAPPTELEDPRPPRFAQAVGLFVASVGILLHLLGVEFGVVYAAGAAFVAAFLNAAFAYCLGCQIYLALKRFGIIRHS